jgi:hypothetical protein
MSDSLPCGFNPLSLSVLGSFWANEAEKMNNDIQKIATAQRNLYIFIPQSQNRPLFSISLTFPYPPFVPVRIGFVISHVFIKKKKRNMYVIHLNRYRNYLHF